MRTRTVLDFIKPGQVWQSRRNPARYTVVRVFGRMVVVNADRGRKRYRFDCSKFRDWYHGLRFVENADGSPATETPPDPPRCARCDSWDHSDKNCPGEATAARILSEPARSALL